MLRFDNVPTLNKLLWLDAFLGSTTGIMGLVFSTPLAGLLGLSTTLILLIAAVTLLYAVLAGALARQQPVSMLWLRVLIIANGLWTGVSLYLLIAYYPTAIKLGVSFLLAQLVVVGVLAYAEGRHLMVATNHPLNEQG
ncbi:hypothetical protein [Hymenobacter sp.]|uniref:hypothetical protein n=1 Tax=Hymenobacter sp. TaxID=1898978 RepID=UPI00286C54D5|nr:hypothetical protein [Hymenobacter sp.]